MEKVELLSLYGVGSASSELACEGEDFIEPGPEASPGILLVLCSHRNERFGKEARGGCAELSGQCW